MRISIIINVVVSRSSRGLALGINEKLSKPSCLSYSNFDVSQRTVIRIGSTFGKSKFRKKISFSYKTATQRVRNSLQFHFLFLTRLSTRRHARCALIWSSVNFFSFNVVYIAQVWKKIQSKTIVANRRAKHYRRVYVVRKNGVQFKNTYLNFEF